MSEYLGTVEYILFIYKNADSRASKEEWSAFFKEAHESGLFRGGSEINNRIQIGNKPAPDLTQSIGGFMKFESDSLDAIQELLRKHPVFIHGGSLELYEMPKS